MSLHCSVITRMWYHMCTAYCIDPNMHTSSFNITLQVQIVKMGFAFPLRGNVVISPVNVKPRVRLFGKQRQYTQPTIEYFWARVE